MTLPGKVLVILTCHHFSAYINFESHLQNPDSDHPGLFKWLLPEVVYGQGYSLPSTNALPLIPATRIEKKEMEKKREENDGNGLVRLPFPI